MDLDEVTASEARLYGRWRDGYQRYWSNFFDPIAARLTATDGKLAVDLTVMPLIDVSDYRRFIEMSRGAQIDATDGDPHPDSLLHWALALNTESQMLQQSTNMLRLFAPQVSVNPLSWIDDTIAVYVDDDPEWEKMAAVDEDERDEFFQKNMYRMPVALHVGVKSGIKLIGFLAGVRAFIDQIAPEMTVWTNLKYKDEPYVKITPSQRALSQDDDFENFAVCYAASGDALIVSLSEEVLKRALDRVADRRQARAEGKEVTNEGAPWLGNNLCLHVKRKFIQLLAAVFRDQYQQRMQVLAWNNLPIMNEWKRRYPVLDPVKLHEQIWHRRLICPGGGEYRWNEQWQTMESTVYGHPGQPQDGHLLPATLQNIMTGNFGSTFEEHGLRVNVELLRGATH